MKFVNLHHHSTFSFGDGFGTPAQHAARAKELGYRAIALTEHGNVSSHFQLEKACAKLGGIKPIYGLEAYCGATNEYRQQFKFHLTLLAENIDGYRSLNRIVTQSWRDYYYHPTVSGSTLAANSAGIVALSGCSGSLLACTLFGGKGLPDRKNPDVAAARDIINRFRCLLGNNYLLEIQPFPELDRTSELNTTLAWLSGKTGTPLVVTHDVHYPHPEDAEMQAVLHAVHRGKASVDDQMREWNYAVPLTLPEADADLYARLRSTGLNARQANEAIRNTGLIADRLNVTLPKAARLRYPQSPEDMEPW